MIELHCYEGRHVPFIRCDNCGQKIRDAQNAVVAWRAMPDPHSAIRRICFIHKGACALEFCEHSSDEWGAMELDRFLIDLFHNAGLRWQHEREKEPVPHSEADDRSGCRDPEASPECPLRGLADGTAHYFSAKVVGEWLVSGKGRKKGAGESRRIDQGSAS
jgi:hypothetical protein